MSEYWIKGLIAAGVIFIVFGATTGCLGLAMVPAQLAARYLPNASSMSVEMPLGQILVSAGFQVAVAAVLIWVGIGSVRGKRWVRPIALIVIERIEGELPWYPALLGILVRVAQMRLDLDLLRRKVGAAAATRATAQGERPVAGTSPAPPVAAPVEATTRSAQIETPPVTAEAADAEHVSVAEVAAAPPEPTEKAAAEESPQIEAARRYARLVATDIRLYNEESVVLGRREGDLAERLQDSLTRGKETFQRRHGDLGPDGLRILYDAFTEVLAGGQADLIPGAILD